jgi:hypothetical protein
MVQHQVVEKSQQPDVDKEGATINIGEQLTIGRGHGATSGCWKKINK